ncbi:hypothetical protein [Nocardioides cynanchi]|nr:hypothetical protein [Nocardioides cynanchi]
MQHDDRPTLIQTWILVSDERGERLEARWVVESSVDSGPLHEAA